MLNLTIQVPEGGEETVRRSADAVLEEAKTYGTVLDWEWVEHTNGDEDVSAQILEAEKIHELARRATQLVADGLEEAARVLRGDD